MIAAFARILRHLWRGVALDTPATVGAYFARRARAGDELIEYAEDGVHILAVASALDDGHDVLVDRYAVALGVAPVQVERTVAAQLALARRRGAR